MKNNNNEIKIQRVHKLQIGIIFNTVDWVSFMSLAILTNIVTVKF